MLRSLLAASILSIASIASATAEPMVRVRVIHTLTETTATLTGGWEITVDEAEPKPAPKDVTITLKADASGAVRLGGLPAAYAGKMIRISPTTAKSTMTVEKVPYGVGWWWEAAEDRRYAHMTEWRVQKDGRLEVVVEALVEEYLRGVVSSEIGVGSPLEAMKAQAVAARSETIRALRSRVYAGDNYDICADVECQAYSGENKRNPECDQAIRETAGLVLFGEGEVLAAYYASNCGGASENIENVWPSRSGAKPWWSANADAIDAKQTLADLTTDDAVAAMVTSTADDYCNPELNPGLPGWAKKNYRWEREISAEQLTQWVAKRKDIGAVLAISTGKRGQSGRLMETTFVGEKGSLTVELELPIRQVFDPPLRSACFVVEPQGEPARPTSFRIIGAGWGHGVGMCQTGAISRALRGQDFKAILAHYYQKAEVKSAY